jgi:hypothetical protein
MNFVFLVIALLLTPAIPDAAQTSSGPSLVGAWTLNADASDQRRGDDSGDRGDRGSGRQGGYGGRGGRGGYGGGMRRGGGGMAGGQRVDPEAKARMRDAMREVIDLSDRLTIVQTESMILVTGADGRTTRLSPDGKKIKDESTGVERKTKWDSGKLVSEISGLGPGKMTQTFSVDPENKQLRITVQTDGAGSRQPRTITHVYDRAQQN